MSATRILGRCVTKISPPTIGPRAVDHEVDRLLERDPEPGHRLVGDRELPDLSLAFEPRHNAPLAADHVSVADRREPGAGIGRVGVALSDDLLRAQIRRAVEVDRVDRLSVLKAMVRGTLLAIALETVFSAPTTFVCGLEWVYSHAGTCFRAAVWMITSTPLVACVRRSRLRTPREPDLLVVAELPCEVVLLELVPAVDSHRGRLVILEDRRVNRIPNEPVPPVIGITFPFSSGEGCTATMIDTQPPQAHF